MIPKIFIINSNVSEAILKYKQTERKMSEACGILLGEIDSGDGLVYITDLTLPSPKDKRTRFSYERDRDTAQKAIEKAFNDSNGIVHYLGEWHTHPEPHPSPSCVDRYMIKRIVKDSKLTLPYAIMLIQGQDTLYAGIRTRSQLTRGEVVYFEGLPRKLFFFSE